ncbi:MAG: ATP-dependent zinc protease family protein, partial [Methyloceanibacter sp.]
TDRRLSSSEMLRVGWREWVRLADLGVAAIKAKIDTGARTSALHAFAIEPFRRGGALWVRFEVHPMQRGNAVKIKCEAPTIDERSVRNSGGQVERRFIIRTLLMLGDRSWPIELALANRDQMGFRMLLGRTALEGRALIEPGRSFLAGQRPPRLHPRQARPALEPSKALP